MAKPAVAYSGPQALLEHGHKALHDDYATRVEKALGKTLPQMEVRVKGLSLTETVAVSKNERHHNTILHNFNGVFQPGSMTLVLGQPGSGKSSLLKVLGGRFSFSKAVTMDGDVEYNGVAQSVFGGRLPQLVSYVPQRDNHFARLAVKETLEFAHECAGSQLSERDEKLFSESDSDKNLAVLEAARAIYKHYPEIVTDQLALKNCENTIVGDAMLRGVSGGERKRVTTGEMQFGDKVVTLMDEISTGLGSAATFNIVKTQRSLAKRLRKTVVMALLQPAPEVFALFDNVIVLNEGYVMYQGPREQVVGYFESLGFSCPADRDVADYLLDLGTDQQSRYEVIGSGRLHRVPRRPQTFAETFEESTIFRAIMSEVHAPLDPTRQHDIVRHFKTVPQFHLGLWRGTWAVTKRDFKVLWRNRSYIAGRVIVLFLVVILYSTLIRDFDPKNAQRVIGTIFPAALFFALGQRAQLPLFHAAGVIFYKQRGANMYRTVSYVISTMVNQVPLAAIEVTIMGVITYFVCGFVSDFWSFIVFQITLFVTHLSFTGWFFLLASITPTIQAADPLASMSMLIYILFSGFVVLHKNIPDYFVWLYWFNPAAWGIRTL